MSKLIICIDGLGHDLISRSNTPFLYNFGKRNSLVRLKTLFAFTGIEYCFFSGETPDKNELWLEFEKSDNSIFNNLILKLLPSGVRDYFAGFLQLIRGRTWLSGLHNIPREMTGKFDTSVKEGLWKMDFFANRDFVFYKWPFFVVKRGGRKKGKIVLRYEGDKERLRRLLKVKLDSGIYYTQLMTIDKTIHKYGKRSAEAEKILKIVDKMIERYVGRFLDEHENGAVVLWGDHGFADIKKYINLSEILPMRNDYLYFIAGTTAHFWFENEDSKKEVLRLLRRVKDVKILDEQNAKKYKIPWNKKNNKYGDLIVYVKKGHYFFPNFYQVHEKERFKAMHGYPDDGELDGFFIMNKKQRKASRLKMNEVIGVLG